MRAMWLVLLVGCGEGSDMESESDPFCNGVGSEYDDGYAMSSGDIQVQLLSEPGPPTRGFNQFTAVVTGTDATPILEPFMNEHGHGTVPATFTGVEGDPGTFDLGEPNLFMPGLWELRVTFEGVDDVLLSVEVCLQG